MIYATSLCPIILIYRKNVKQSCQNIFEHLLTLSPVNRIMNGHRTQMNGLIIEFVHMLNVRDLEEARRLQHCYHAYG